MSQLQMMATPARDMFHIKLDGYTLSIRKEPARYLHDVLESQYSLCRQSSTAAFTTVLKSKDRLITIEMSRSNGLLFTVTYKDDTNIAGKAIGYVQWSDIGKWVSDFYDGFITP